MGIIIVKAKQKNYLHWIDVVLPIAVVLFWVGVTMLGYGHQSLTHIVEVPIVLVVLVVMFYIKILFVDKAIEQSRKNSFISLRKG